MKKLNILFVLSDQHSSRFLGTVGDRYVETPNFDRMISDGVYFDNAYCQDPLCVPSRASLITGRYSRNLGIYENRHVLQSNTVTLPRYLGQCGYRTCLIGKSHFNGEQFQGYQQRPYGDLLGQGHQPEYIRTGAAWESEHGLEDLLDNSGPTAIPLPMTQTEIVVAETVKWLQLYADSSDKRPFFLSVQFDKPHFPYRAPKKFFEKYVGRVSLPRGRTFITENGVEFVRKAVEINGGWEHYGKDQEIHERALASYCACIEWVDDAFGRIVDSLDYLGLSDDTIIIYSSDHGEMAGEKGAWQKTLFYDDSSKIPLIMRWKGHIKAGCTVHDIVGLIDIFPTLCAFADLDVPAWCDGLSLKDLLEHGTHISRNHIFSESVVLKTPEHAGCMLREGKFKYNYYLQGKHELYDLDADPEEKENLIDSAVHTEIKMRMCKKIEAFWDPVKQVERYLSCPMMKSEKHFYLYSNQFISGDGSIFNGRP